MTALCSTQTALLHLPSGEIAVDGWIEAEYPEQGIICLADENHQYQVVADGTYITLGNGVRYDFETRLFLMPRKQPYDISGDALKRR